MIVAIGVDLVEVSRVRGVDERSRRFRDRVFTPDEIAYCERQPDPARSFAARFAAKEAVMKCLRTGWADGVGFRQIDVRRQPSGAVDVALSGRAAGIAEQLHIATIHLSISHTDAHATAFAVAESRTT